MYITKGDLEEHGYTAGCPGCVSVLRAARQGHMDGCRRRVEGEMAGTGKATRAKKRKEDFYEPIRCKFMHKMFIFVTDVAHN